MSDNIDKNQGTTDQTSTDVDQTDDKPQYLTSEQFNKALSARERAFEKKMQKLMEDNAKLVEKLSTGTKQEEEKLSRTAELERTVKELSKNIQQRDARDKANNLRKATEQSLRNHGVDPEFAEHALAYLIDAKQAVKYDDEGNMVMVLNGITYDDLEEGMAVWAQSRDAKLYKKPTNTQGSGDVGSKRFSQSDNFAKNGQIDLKRSENLVKNFNVSDPKLTLDRNTKSALSQLLGKKLLEKK